MDASRSAQPRAIASTSSCSHSAPRRIGVSEARASSSARPRSFRASFKAKRGSKLPRRYVAGSRTLRLIMLPSAAFLKTSTMVSGATPALTPTVQHSAIVRSRVKLAQLCMILQTEPQPMAPTWMTRAASEERCGGVALDVVDDQLVTGAEELAGHGVADTPDADEPELHRVTL